MPSLTLYDSIRSQRQTQSNQSRLYNRLMLAGYLHEQNCKKLSIDPQRMIKQSIMNFKTKLTGYLYIKGYFYIHILESTAIQIINLYLKQLYTSTSNTTNIKNKFNQTHKDLRVVYQAYQQEDQLFKGYQCDNSAQQAGPILIETDKLEEQVLQRSMEIYDFFEQGAKTKKANPAHRIGNMILLNNDDMSLLVSKHFMSISEYIEMYLNELPVTKESELNYPLPPNVFKMIEFIQIGEDYKVFVE